MLALKKGEEATMCRPVQFSTYTILFVKEGEGTYHADFGSFSFKAPVLLFATPLQIIYIKESRPLQFTMLQFHGYSY